MSLATCQTKEIDRAHRSHSTREAKQNETNKKNQGSPIKTIRSHDSILVPLLGRGVFTAGFAPPRPFPTPTYKCVGGSRSRESRLVARRRLASSSSLCQEAMNFSAPCNSSNYGKNPSQKFKISLVLWNALFRTNNYLILWKALFRTNNYLIICTRK